MIRLIDHPGGTPLLIFDVAFRFQQGKGGADRSAPEVKGAADMGNRRQAVPIPVKTKPDPRFVKIVNQQIKSAAFLHKPLRLLFGQIPVQHLLELGDLDGLGKMGVHPGP